MTKIFELDEEETITTLEFVNNVLETDKQPGDMFTVNELATVMSHVIQSEAMEFIAKSLAIRLAPRPTHVFEINIPPDLFDGLFNDDGEGPDEEEL
jgi:hypothetical protein